MFLFVSVQNVLLSAGRMWFLRRRFPRMMYSNNPFYKFFFGPRCWGTYLDQIITCSSTRYQLIKFWPCWSFIQVLLAWKQNFIVVSAKKCFFSTSQRDFGALIVSTIARTEKFVFRIYVAFKNIFPSSRVWGLFLDMERATKIKPPQKTKIWTKTKRDTDKQRVSCVLMTER